MKASVARLKEMDSRQRKGDGKGFVSLFEASLKLPRTDIEAIKEKAGRSGKRKNVEEDDDDHEELIDLNKL